MNEKAYCVVYRTGGTLNFKWHRTAAADLETAKKWSDEIKKQGYYVILEDHALSLAIGLPSTYE